MGRLVAYESRLELARVMLADPDQAWLRDYEVAAGEVFAVLPPGQRPALMTALRILSADS